MGRSWKTRRVSASFLLAFGAVSLALSAPLSAQADAFEKALAEIDEALETNPNGVPEESLRSCRAMRKTALLLLKMGHYDRAVRRIKGCRRLLGLAEAAPRSERSPDLPCCT